MFIVKVQGHSCPQPGKRQLLGGSRSEVIAMDRFPHGVQDEFVLLCTDTQNNREDGLGGAEEALPCLIGFFLTHEPQSHWHSGVEQG